MASYSFSSPGYVNIPPYYNTTPNGYSGLNFQYSLPDSKIPFHCFSFNQIFHQVIQQLVLHQLLVHHPIVLNRYNLKPKSTKENNIFSLDS
jgi:hypothetical protein